MDDNTSIIVSIVSHKQASIIYDLLNDLQRYCAPFLEVILTLNIQENLPFDITAFNYPIKLIRNETPRGFGANHNAAFTGRNGSYFCVMKPDIRLSCNPFPALLECCKKERSGVIAPIVTNTDGSIEKSARRFPTPMIILAKLLGHETALDYSIGNEYICVEWVAGMFMFFPSSSYKEIGGFDENYFLYYEDVDICARLWLAKFKVILCPKVSIIHEARHESHHNLKYLKWHLSSMMRFFLMKLHWRLTGRRLTV